ncbi:beta-ketoacyl synthase N-terminal-like domain-containing protein [Nocardia ninae]|uniref:3-oxoacyl-[acyl-carrier-protein] synthase 2 n=1 Tax=Nocardia ninae NBRC 108245 TaxID=1210091 RepID=A0A511MDN2_9NOCA|nr:beta-ketoacyl synthase N-terminal-like domain-containing protein [Nocardia ninae]GEM38774.1 3-oxoacyl-[acyl-carrier-protein] synthase 2 [Nocardia ninae NBRC 108245]
MGERVVVTGVGAVSALGNEPRTQWNALLRGASGVGALHGLAEDINLAESAARPLAAGRVHGIDPRDWISDRKAARAMRLHTHMAFAATGQAMTSAKIHRGNVDADATGITLGIAMIDYDIADLELAARRSLHDPIGFDIERFCRTGWRAISPMVSIVMLNNATLCQIAMQYGLHGPNASFSPFGEAGGQAIGAALRMLQEGDAQVMLAGGVSPRLNLSALQRFLYLGVVAETADPAAGSCKPFDRDRTGTVPGEGAAVLVLETLTHARDRGAHILAEVLGHGAAVGVPPGGEPHPPRQAIEQSLATALDDAELTPDRLAAVYADAPGLPSGDAVEAAAISAVLGRHAADIPVTSTKGATGHLLAAALPLHSVFAVHSLVERYLPAITNLRHPEPDSGLDLVCGRPRRISTGDAIACLGAGFRGQSECVVFGAFEAKGA